MDQKFLPSWNFQGVGGRWQVLGLHFSFASAVELRPQSKSIVPICALNFLVATFQNFSKLLIGKFLRLFTEYLVIVFVELAFVFDLN